MDTNLITDDEILMNISEGNEEAKVFIINKYKYIIDILHAKYKDIFFKLNIEKDEVYAEALFGFNDAINGYRDNKNATFTTFLSLCIKRRLIKLIRKNNTEKSKFNNGTYSLDYVYETMQIPLKDVLGDSKNDPLKLTMEKESIRNLKSKIKENLSKFEYTVYEYMIENFNYNDIAIILEKNPKQIDNAIQRIKLKIKEIITHG